MPLIQAILITWDFVASHTFCRSHS